jgi:hypothetical protein
MTEAQIHDRLRASAFDMVMEAASRGEDLSIDIAWMRVVGRYNCNQKEWLRSWREQERKKKAYSNRPVRLF